MADGDAPHGWQNFVTLALWTAGSTPDIWSPYYRTTVLSTNESRATVHVNGSMHQWILNPEEGTAGEDFGLLQAKADYQRRYRWIDRTDTVLVVGARTGNDIVLLLDRTNATSALATTYWMSSWKVSWNFHRLQ